MPAGRLQRETFLIDNLLVRTLVIRWTGFAPWEFEFLFPGSLTSTLLGSLYLSSWWCLAPAPAFLSYRCSTKPLVLRRCTATRLCPPSGADRISSPGYQRPLVDLHTTTLYSSHQNNQLGSLWFIVTQKKPPPPKKPTPLPQPITPFPSLPPSVLHAMNPSPCRERGGIERERGGGRDKRPTPSAQTAC